MICFCALCSSLSGIVASFLYLLCIAKVTNSQLMERFEEVNRRIDGQDETLKSIQSSLEELTSAVKALVITQDTKEVKETEPVSLIIEDEESDELWKPKTKIATDEHIGSASSCQKANSPLPSVRYVASGMENVKPVPNSCQKADNDSKQLESVYTFDHKSNNSNHTYPVPTKSQIGMELQDGLTDKEKQIRDNGGKPEGSDHISLITRFDICPKNINTGGLRLKPSLLMKNKEKRKQMKLAAEGPNIIILKPGMVLMKGYISHNDQVKIVKTCRELGMGEGGFYQPGYRNGAKLHLRMMCLGKNWDPQSSQYDDIRTIDNSKPPSIPDYFHDMVKRAIQDSNDHIKKNKGKVIPLMSPDICIAKFYTKEGKLGLHQDKDESRESLNRGLPVVSFSIGDTGEFLYGNDRDIEKAEKVNLESGDVLIFGGESRHIFHGVSSIVSETAPKSLLEATDMRDGRLNLTFRQF